MSSLLTTPSKIVHRPIRSMLRPADMAVFNHTETEEHAYLEQVKERISAELARSDANVTRQFDDAIEMKQYLQDSKADMDHVEKVSVRESIEQMSRMGEHGLRRHRQLSRLLNRPTFPVPTMTRKWSASARSCAHSTPGTMKHSASSARHRINKLSRLLE